MVWNKIHIILFWIIMIAGMILCTLHPVRDFSEMENRVLTAYPKVTIDGIVSGEVQRDFAQACGDQMTGRDFFVQLSTGVRFALGERQIGDVYIGEDVRYFERVTTSDISEKRISTNTAVIERLSTEHPDISTTFFLAPTNSTVARDTLPEGAYIYDDSAVAESIEEGLKSAKLLYEPDAFSGRDYFSTDHHWNTYGALRGAGLYLDAVGKATSIPDESDFSYVTADDKFYGTLYSKAPLAACDGEDFTYPVISDDIEVTIDGEPAGFYDTSYLDKKDKYATYFGGNYGIVEIKNPHAATDDTLLIVKDSYANSAIPYLSSVYKKITMIDLRYVNKSMKSLLEEECPDELLFLYEMSDFGTDENFSKLLR